jgi:hypothetical protein
MWRGQKELTVNAESLRDGKVGFTVRDNIFLPVPDTLVWPKILRVCASPRWNYLQ